MPMGGGWACRNLHHLGVADWACCAVSGRINHRMVRFAARMVQNGSCIAYMRCGPALLAGKMVNRAIVTQPYAAGLSGEGGVRSPVSTAHVSLYIAETAATCGRWPQTRRAGSEGWMSLRSVSGTGPVYVAVGRVRREAVVSRGNRMAGRHANQAVTHMARSVGATAHAAMALRVPRGGRP